MTDLEKRIREGDLGFLDLDALSRFVAAQRWFGGRDAEPQTLSIAATNPFRQARPYLVHVIAALGTGGGQPCLYQVPLGFRHADEGWTEGIVQEVGGWVAYDALTDPLLVRHVALRMGASLDGDTGPVHGVAMDGATPVAAAGPVRPIAGEQSNTSVEIDGQAVLKLYRKLEAGPNPELELLQFLTEHGFEHAPELLGYATYEGEAVESTIAVLVRYVQAEGDGWVRVRDALARGEGEAVLGELERLGEIVGRMHAVLGSDPSQPSFAPEEPGAETLALLSARIDEEIEATFAALPDTPELRPLADRGPEVLDRLRLLRRPGSIGRLIRTHGDLHLGQVLRTGDTWMVIDFEGEPRRPLLDRRRKASPLRDAAGLLRSLAYAAAAARHAGEEPPAGWEGRARQAFLLGYLPAVAPSGLLPVTPSAIEEVLRLYELEKAAYELRYDLAHRPDWVAVPVAGILQLLEEPRAEPA
ncbi:MAG: hypothetical protein R3C15_20145 [Thermoleophilia bacterium]